MGNHFSPNLPLFCREGFGPFLPRHHCRLCGRVVCDECSEGRALSIGKTVCVCLECLVHLRGDGLRSKRTQPWPWLQGLEQIKRQLDELMPLYWQRLRELELETMRPQELLADAHALRNTLLLQLKDLQAQLEEDDSTVGGLKGRLRKAIALAYGKWARERHCWLLVKPRLPPPRSTPPRDIPPPTSGLASRSASSYSLLQRLFTTTTTSMNAGGDQEAELLPLPANFATLMTQLEVMQEQRSNLNGQLDAAVKGREWEQVTSLQRALEEIDREIARLKAILSQ